MADKKILATLVILPIAAFAVIVSGNMSDNIPDIFYIEGTYYADEQFVLISYSDSSSKTTSVTLEILGLDESFQKIYTSNTFEEVVFFAEPPKHGWKVHPITLVIQHDDLGTIHTKTEIHNAGDPVPTVIFGSS